MEIVYGVKSVLEMMRAEQLFIIHQPWGDHMKLAGACWKQTEVVVLCSVSTWALELLVRRHWVLRGYVGFKSIGQYFLIKEEFMRAVKCQKINTGFPMRKKEKERKKGLVLLGVGKKLEIRK